MLTSFTQMRSRSTLEAINPFTRTSPHSSFPIHESNRPLSNSSRITLVLHFKSPLELWWERNTGKSAELLPSHKKNQTSSKKLWLVYIAKNSILFWGWLLRLSCSTKVIMFTVSPRTSSTYMYGPVWAGICVRSDTTSSFLHCRPTASFEVPGCKE